MSAIEEMTSNIFGATLTRGKFVKGAGALVVGLSVPVALTTGSAGAAPATTDPTQVASWLQIHADNTITMFTGRAEMGQGSASGAIAQIVAEELNFPYESITKIVMGDTDRTPDGGLSAGFLYKALGATWPEAFGGGMLNMQRV